VLIECNQLSTYLPGSSGQGIDCLSWNIFVPHVHRGCRSNWWWLRHTKFSRSSARRTQWSLSGHRQEDKFCYSERTRSLNSTMWKEKQNLNAVLIVFHPPLQFSRWLANRFESRCQYWNHHASNAETKDHGRSYYLCCAMSLARRLGKYQCSCYCGCFYNCRWVDVLVCQVRKALVLRKETGV